MSDDKKTDVLLDCMNCAHYFSCKPECISWNMFEPHPDLFEEEEIVTEEKGALATQVGGAHYQLPIQPIDFIVKNDIPYREGNAIKYIVRHANKNGKQDIEKAIHYLQMILEDYDV